MKNILVLKLSENHENNHNSIEERSKGDWKISPKRLDNVEYVFVLENSKVIGTYKLGEKMQYNRSTGRVSDLEFIKTHDMDDMKGQLVSYPTSNPATLATLGKLKDNIKTF